MQFTNGAKVKTCKYEGCTYVVVRGGVCFRHGAKRNANEMLAKRLANTEDVPIMSRKEEYVRGMVQK